MVSLGSFNECFDTLAIDGLDAELREFLLFLVYAKGENLEQLRYGALFDLIESRLSGSLGASTESRKRPESSSPEKLKARNVVPSK